MTYYEAAITRIREHAYNNGYLYTHLMQAKKFMEANFSEAINLDEIANAACLSKFHFIRLFKLAYNKTPHQYLTAIRIGKAKNLLRAGKKTEEVCFEIGFSSAGSFKTLFKRHTSRTPAFYRQNNGGKEMPLQKTPPYLLFHYYLQKSNFQDGK